MRKGGGGARKGQGPRQGRAGPARPTRDGARHPHAKRTHGPPKRDARDARDARDNRAGPHNPRPDRAHGAEGKRQPQRSQSHAGQARHPAHPANKHETQAPVRWTPEQLEQALVVHAPTTLKRGDWLWTMRDGAERDLIEELFAAAPHGALRPRKVAAALVASAAAPPEREGRLDVTFARQGFRIANIATADATADLVTALAPTLDEYRRDNARYALHVFVPDSAQGNQLAGRAQALREAFSAGQSAEASQLEMEDSELRRHGGLIVQVCVLDAKTAAIGCIRADQALSLWPGGRSRMRLGGDFPSRAARKLAEAFAWFGLSPGSGELCVDLGAAPGGWSWLLLEKKARVIAVDPARMDEALMRNSRLKHVQGNAFEYFPDEPADWLFCDMAYRPLEVAQMLGRWARRRQTRLLIANFKLPMKRKVEIVERLRGLLEESGFVGVRTRQLYHDREEITVAAHVR